MSKAGRNDRRSRCLCNRTGAGFAYLGLLILLAIMGVVSAAAIQVGVVMHRRAAEEALLDVGNEFSRALESYRRATPAGQPDAPATLQDLLQDPRFPGVVRHLRKLYPDPITGRQEWGILRDEESGDIVGVSSLSNAKPIKVANFDARHMDFAGKSSYQEWVFTGDQAAAATARETTYTRPLDLLGEPEPGPATDPSTNPPPDQLGPGRTSPRDLL